MGRKKNRRGHHEPHLDVQEACGSAGQGAKSLSKSQKKLRKQAKKQQVTVTKNHRWYKMKVIEPEHAAPEKEFLQESFRSLLDGDFDMLGFHQSQHTARFYLENNSTNSTAAQDIAALNRRMQGAGGRLMQIVAEPCSKFLLLNAPQIAIVKQVLENRYDVTTGVMNLTRFHYDPLLLSERVLPVLSDADILKQVLNIVRKIPDLKGLDLSHNSLRISHVKVLVATLTDNYSSQRVNPPLQRLNLGHNDIDNVKDLMDAFKGSLPLIELKLEGNDCLKNIKDPEVYLKIVQSKCLSLQTLDGVDIAEYLASRAATALPSTPATPSASVSQALVNKFLEEFYNCLDSEHRLQLVNAFVPRATLEIQSLLPTLPSISQRIGHDGIREALTTLPASIHAQDSFSLETVKCEPSEGQMKVSGQVQLNGQQVCSFVHAFSIVPYNNGLGCSMCILGFQ